MFSVMELFIYLFVKTNTTADQYTWYDTSDISMTLVLTLITIIHFFSIRPEGWK